MPKDPMKWKTYEDVARYLLNDIAEKFGLQRIEGKQKLEGKKTGTKWEVEGKGICVDGKGFIIMECRRYLTSKQDQGKLGSLAYTIIDTGAEGAIIVSPLGLQKGADMVANAENIVKVYLNADADPYNYVLKFLNKIMLGLSESAQIGEQLNFHITHKDGTTETRQA